MKQMVRRIPLIFVLPCVVLLPLFGLTSCASSTTTIAINWVDFIQFNGITYLAVPSKPGRAETASDLGPVFATVAFRLSGTVQNPNYQRKDGDAAYLDPGTKVYRVKGYRASFRLAVYAHPAGLPPQLTLYEADTNPNARTGADLLDIGGKVQTMSIVSDQDGVSELGVITDPKLVNKLLAQVLQAPVDQNRLLGDQRYFLVFHLIDGTTVTRAYWLDSEELARGILLPKTFGQAIQAALPTR